MIISLVRSNEEGRCGFLRTPNRINVLLSRAQHGMYLIGNADTASTAQMWEDVISIFKHERNIGPALPLQCFRHPNTTIEVSKPEDFAKVAPNGGCLEKCGKTLKCGHIDDFSVCHSDLMHDATVCRHPCTRIAPNCPDDHICVDECGLPCPPCKRFVEGHFLPCGHGPVAVECSKVKNLDLVKCVTKIERSMPCGHVTTVECHNKESTLTHCTTICGVKLDCEHACDRACCLCRVYDQDVLVSAAHGPCRGCKVRCESECLSTRL